MGFDCINSLSLPFYLLVITFYRQNYESLSSNIRGLFVAHDTNNIASFLWAILALALLSNIFT